MRFVKHLPSQPRAAAGTHGVFSCRTALHGLVARSDLGRARGGGGGSLAAESSFLFVAPPVKSPQESRAASPKQRPVQSIDCSRSRPAPTGPLHLLGPLFAAH